MASVTQSPTFLPNDSPSSLGGNAAVYQEKMNGGAQLKVAQRKGGQAQAQQRGGQGHGFEGKMIAPGVAEVSSYKGGKRRQSKRRQNKKNQSKKNQSKKNQTKRGQSKKNQRK
jgi:hypothetical protein